MSRNIGLYIWAIVINVAYWGILIIIFEVKDSLWWKSLLQKLGYKHKEEPVKKVFSDNPWERPGYNPNPDVSWDTSDGKFWDYVGIVVLSIFIIYGILRHFM